MALKTEHTLRVGTGASDELQNSGFTATAVTGSVANVKTALSDALDRTYARKSVTSVVNGWWNLNNPTAGTPAAGRFIASVGLFVRLSQGAGGSTTAILYTTSNATVLQLPLQSAQGQNYKSISTYSRSGTTVTVYTASNDVVRNGDVVVIEGTTSGQIDGAWTVTAAGTADGLAANQFTFTHTTSGTISSTGGGRVSVPYTASATVYAGSSTATWNNTYLNNLTARLQDTTSANTIANAARFYDMWAFVVEADLPAFGSVVTTSGTGTSRPTFGLGAYTQADSYMQNGVQVKVFTAQKTDPSVNTDLVWDSGVIANTSSVTIPVDLVDGTYYVYARTACDASGTGNYRVWSAWGSGTANSTTTGGSFTVSVTPPTTPSFNASTPSWNTSTHVVSLSAVGAAFAGGTQTYEFQRSTDGGTTWYPIRNAQSVTPNGSYVAVASDFEAKRNTTMRYRVRSVGVSGSLRYVSAWSTAATVSTTGATGWTFRSFTPTALHKELLNVRVLTNPAIQQMEDVAVFRPLGRTTPVVLSGDIEGLDGSWTILVKGTTEWQTFRQIINSQKLILVCDPFGGYRYVRVIGRSWTQQGVYGSEYWEVQVDYVEVGGDYSGVTATTTVGGSGTGTGQNDVPLDVS